VANYYGGAKRCQEGNPVLSLGVPTMTGMIRNLHTGGMSPGADPPTADGPPSPHRQHVMTLGVAEVVMTILEARKTMTSATAAAVSRNRQDGGVRVRVSLLEGTQSPDGTEGGPDGTERVIAIFMARELSGDLADAFGTTDVITLK
jgi:hypothetical protein